MPGKVWNELGRPASDPAHQGAVAGRRGQGPTRRETACVTGRLGLLADVHGNLPALEVALAALEQAGVDRIVCCGDIVGYGPYPNECVELVAERVSVCVAGNHDLMAVGRISDDGAGELARFCMAWTRRELAAEARRYICELPERAALEDLLVTHGSLTDVRTYVIRPREAARQLSLLHEYDATLLILGHTHEPLVYREPGGVLLRGSSGESELPNDALHLINPGSVGQARETRPLVRFGVLDHPGRRVRLQALEYPHEACQEALRARGLPPDAVHRPPPGGLWPRLAKLLAR
jgi:putative phosphoesterase